jgi:uncharacterized membrane protein YvbJ
MVFCNECGFENPDGAKYCQECGKEVNKDVKTSVSPNNTKTEQKSPLGAAVLNLIIAGAGFVYIHEYAKAVLSFIIVLVAGMISSVLGFSVLFGIIALIFVMAWCYDETKKYNLDLN